MKWHVFNPQHDLALGTGDGFNAPTEALKMARDCAVLPLWYAEEGDGVYAPDTPSVWLEETRERFPALRGIAIGDAFGPSDTLAPWGVDSEVSRRFGLKGGADTERTRAMSHRRHTRTAMLLLQERLGFALPEPAEELTRLADAVAFAERRREWVFKAPLSGSGRGIMAGSGTPDSITMARVANIIGRQGSIMGERRLDKVQDFAMETRVTASGECVFEGYSLFGTRSGTPVYDGNTLLPDPEIETLLAARLPPGTLESIRRALTGLLPELLPGYAGPVGVDMLLYRHADGGLRVDPMVEMNLRLTMGWVARRFFDRFCDPCSTGALRLTRFRTEKERERFRLAPAPVVSGGRVVSGVMSLTPVTVATAYAVTASVNPR